MVSFIREDKKLRWSLLFLLSFVMFAAYIASDNIFAVEKVLTEPGYGYEVTTGEYSSLAGAYSILNVYLLMIIIGGLILDKKGIRFTGIASCIVMILGIGMLAWGMFSLRGGTSFHTVNFLGEELRMPVFWSVLGIAVYGVGAETAGITVTKIIAKWFRGKELALAMGIQLALARLGTGLAYGASPSVAKAFGNDVGIVVLVGLITLTLGLIAFLAYAIYDRKFDRQVVEFGITLDASSPDEEFHLKDVLTIFRNPAFWVIAILCLLFYAAVNPFLKYSTGMMVSKFGMSETTAGLIPMILPMGCIVLTPLFANIYDRKGHGADLMILGALIILGVHLTFSLPVLSNPISAIALMVLLGIGFAMLPSAMWPSIAKIMPQKLLGTTMALTFFIQNFGFIFAPKAVAAIKNVSDSMWWNDGTYYTWFSLFFALLGAIALILAISVKIMDRRKGYGLQKPNIEKKITDGQAAADVQTA